MSIEKARSRKVHIEFHMVLLSLKSPLWKLEGNYADTINERRSYIANPGAPTSTEYRVRLSYT